MNPAPWPRILPGFVQGDGGGELQDVQGDAGVPAREGGDAAEGARIGAKARPPQPALLIREGPAQDPDQVLLVQGLEDEHAGAREEGGDHLEGGILGRGPDEGEGSVLDVGQEAVLLGLVEAVDLVDEEDGAPPAAALTIGLLDGLADLLHAVEDGAHGEEAGRSCGRRRCARGWSSRCRAGPRR